MLAIAAAYLGYKVAVLGPGGRESPAGHVAYWAHAWGSKGEVSHGLLEEFCQLVSVVLIEWENVPLDLVRRIEAKGVPVRPGPKALSIAQDRLFEKQLAQTLNIPVPAFGLIDEHSHHQHIAATPCILKTRRDGYDGKGQVRIPAGDSIEEAWRSLGRVPCILEEVVNFTCEISMIIARSPSASDDKMSFYGPFENKHVNGILRQTSYPMSNPFVSYRSQYIRQAAYQAMRQLATALDVHGLLAVEFFVARDGTILFNEMAPRPHNSGHLTIECCHTSQFEQYVRAACNLPLGSSDFHSRGDMINLIGEEAHKAAWYMENETNTLHLYGKEEVKKGRKMGHVVQTCPWK
ncbi:5-(carboxyamino)imidazole ribonucleotide synthase [Candidatus Kaiserbacteria bacterium]|nr:5-(carboxyamino)imidazole ribonucleotide synthase [Candidatus Kaiserbacteria bacterium]